MLLLNPSGLGSPHCLATFLFFGGGNSGDVGSGEAGSSAGGSADAGSGEVGSVEAGSAGAGSAEVDSAEAGSSISGAKLPWGLLFRQWPTFFGLPLFLLTPRGTDLTSGVTSRNPCL